MKMVQGEVIECLEKSKVPMSRTQIAEAIKDDPIKVSHALRQLVKWKEVKCMEINRH